MPNNTTGVGVFYVVQSIAYIVGTYLMIALVDLFPRLSKSWEERANCLLSITHYMYIVCSVWGCSFSSCCLG